MRRRVKAIVRVVQAVILSPLLPAAAVMLIAIFTVSLALAEPHDETALIASHDELSESPFDRGRGLASDAIVGTESAILSRPLQPPFYHDRYRFYHRYDHGLRSRFNTIDDGVE